VHILPNLGDVLHLQDFSLVFASIFLILHNSTYCTIFLPTFFLPSIHHLLTYLNVKSCLLGSSLSASCVPLYNFNYTYDYIMSTSTSFVDRYKHLTFALGFLALVKNELWRRISCYICEWCMHFADFSILTHQLFFCSCHNLSTNSIQLCNAGGSFADNKHGRYNPRMDPIIPVENWRKGSQVPSHLYWWKTI
jgi:hypothetical protein